MVSLFLAMYLHSIVARQKLVLIKKMESYAAMIMCSEFTFIQLLS